MSHSRSIFVALTVSLASVLAGWRVSAVVFMSPNQPPPEGNVAPPVMTSSEPQTKLGGLSVWNLSVGTQAQPASLTIGHGGGSSEICWNGTCKTNWYEVFGATDYLRLGPSDADTGSIQLESPAGPYPENPIPTLSAKAGVPTLQSPTYGLYARATGSSDPTKKSYAVYGQANNAAQYAVYSTNTDGNNVWHPYAWAGYFEGDVAVNKFDEMGTYDLVIGTGSANGNAVGEICLNGDCESSWPVVGNENLWTLDGSIMHPATPGKSIAVGGIGHDAPLTVTVATTGLGAPLSADLSVRADAQFNQYVVGSPPAGMAKFGAGGSCGDGKCNNGETNTFCTPHPPCGTYCPEDCDTTAPQQISMTSRSSDIVTRKVTFNWEEPAGTPDFAGVRIIRMVGLVLPSGPNDPNGTAYTIPAGTKTWTTPDSHDLQTNHFYGFYSVDLRGLFSPGIIEFVFFS